ncbi:hypothetical protein C8F01DRAFT_191107 [Mycena amicta]|nr:hypothetical protein C8F01DRAFT_191107 [Mycena amicta]
MEACRSSAAAHDNLMKINVIYQNDQLQKSEAMKGLGFPDAPATVLVTGEAKTKQDLMNCMRDPEYSALVAGGASFGLHDGACVFSADVVTKIDHCKSPKGSETCHGIFIFKIPAEWHPDVDEYHKKVEDMVDKFIQLPIAEQHIVKHTIVGLVRLFCIAT